MTRRRSEDGTDRNSGLFAHLDDLSDIELVKFGTDSMRRTLSGVWSSFLSCFFALFFCPVPCLSFHSHPPAHSSVVVDKETFRPLCSSFEFRFWLSSSLLELEKPRREVVERPRCSCGRVSSGGPSHTYRMEPARLAPVCVTADVGDVCIDKF